MSNVINKLMQEIKSNPKLIADILLKDISKENMKVFINAIVKPNILIKYLLEDLLGRAEQENKFDAEYIKQIAKSFNSISEMLENIELSYKDISNIHELSKLTNNIINIYKLFIEICENMDNSMRLAISKKASLQKVGSSDKYKKWVFEEIKKLESLNESSNLAYGNYTYNNALNKTMFSKNYRNKLQKEFDIKRSLKTIRGWIDEYFRYKNR